MWSGAQNTTDCTVKLENCFTRYGEGVSVDDGRSGNRRNSSSDYYILCTLILCANPCTEHRCEWTERERKGEGERKRKKIEREEDHVVHCLITATNVRKRLFSISLEYSLCVYFRLMCACTHWDCDCDHFIKLQNAYFAIEQMKKKIERFACERSESKSIHLSSSNGVQS